MFCPQCGLERISEQTNFCSRCGFLLTGVSRLLQTGGEILGNVPVTSVQGTSARSRGLKQGLFIFLLTFLVVPIVAIISIALKIEPWAVAISSIVLFVGGILRMVYALMFEPLGPTLTSSTSHDPRHAFFQKAAQNSPELPPRQTYPASEYVAPKPGGWRESNDLQPISVTESTTKLLEKEEGNQ